MSMNLKKEAIYQVYVVFPSVFFIDEGWLRMFLVLTNTEQSKTMCLIESDSLHWLYRGCSSCFMICMTDSCSCVDNFGMSRDIGLSIPFSNFFFN